MAAKKDDADELYKIPERVSANAHIKGMHNYLTTWEESVEKVDDLYSGETRTHAQPQAPAYPPLTRVTSTLTAVAGVVRRVSGSPGSRRQRRSRAAAWLAVTLPGFQMESSTSA